MRYHVLVKWRDGGRWHGKAFAWDWSTPLQANARTRQRIAEAVREAFAHDAAAVTITISSRKTTIKQTFGREDGRHWRADAGGSGGEAARYEWPPGNVVNMADQALRFLQRFTR